MSEEMVHRKRHVQEVVRAFYLKVEFITVATLQGHRGLDVSENTRYKRLPSESCGNL